LLRSFTYSSGGFEKSRPPLFLFLKESDTRTGG
jgi:hypothetical protein